MFLRYFQIKIVENYVFEDQKNIIRIFYSHICNNLVINNYI